MLEKKARRYVSAADKCTNRLPLSLQSSASRLAMLPRTVAEDPRLAFNRTFILEESGGLGEFVLSRHSLQPMRLGVGKWYGQIRFYYDVHKTSLKPQHGNLLVLSSPQCTSLEYLNYKDPDVLALLPYRSVVHEGVAFPAFLDSWFRLISGGEQDIVFSVTDPSFRPLVRARGRPKKGGRKLGVTVIQKAES